MFPASIYLLGSNVYFCFYQLVESYAQHNTIVSIRNVLRAHQLVESYAQRNTIASIRNMLRATQYGMLLHTFKAGSFSLRGHFQHLQWREVSVHGLASQHGMTCINSP